MPKRTLFTNITPLPAQVSREVAIAMLHNHDEMIELNPLVIEHHPIKTPRDAPADEFLDCVWQEMTDRISYLPGGMVKGKITYRACFHDLPKGLQTHIYAPLGLDIREKWTIGGFLPGEPPEARELGLDLPTTGLYLREDCDMKCSRMTTGFVRKNLDNSHKTLVERILKKAERVEQMIQSNPTSPQAGMVQVGSHMARSAIAQSVGGHASMTPQMLSPQGDDGRDLLSQHPAFRNDDSNRFSMASYHLPSYAASTNSRESSYMSDVKSSHSRSPNPTTPNVPAKQFVAELPGSTYFADSTESQSQHSQSSHGKERKSYISELPGSDAGQTSPAENKRYSYQESSRHSDTDSHYSELPAEMNQLNMNRSASGRHYQPGYGGPPSAGQQQPYQPQQYQYNPQDYVQQTNVPRPLAPHRPT